MDVVDSDWIKERLTGQRGQLTRLADAIGISRQKMTKIMTGERRVQASEIPAIVSFFDEIQLDQMGDAPDVRSPPPDFLVPVATLDKGEAADLGLALPASYIRRMTNSDPGRLAIIRAQGDTMEPTLHDGDLVLLDTSRRDLSWDGLFVIRHRSALQVKRIARSANRRDVRLISDNSRYPALEVPTADVDPVGRVLWYGRKV